MKPRSERLTIVCDLALRREQQALNHLQQARQALDLQRSQLEDLRQYRAQYLESMKRGLSGRVDIQQIQVYQSFIRQIETAIAQQEGVVARAEQLFERSSKVWQACHQKLTSYRELVERYRREEQRLAERKQEKQLEDEFTTRLRFRR
jgi:flagellar FliJ protein